jgi:hypothetical protein
LALLLEPEAPDEPDAPAPDEPELAAPEPAPVPPPGPAAPSPPALQPFAVYCGSLGFNFAHAGLAVPLLLLFDEPLVPLVELLSLFAIVTLLSFDEVEPEVPLMPEALLFDFSVLELPFVPEALLLPEVDDVSVLLLPE